MGRTEHVALVVWISGEFADTGQNPWPALTGASLPSSDSMPASAHVPKEFCSPLCQTGSTVGAKNLKEKAIIPDNPYGTLDGPERGAGCTLAVPVHM